MGALISEVTISAAHIETSEHRWHTGSDGQSVTEDYLKAGVAMTLCHLYKCVDDNCYKYFHVP